jgi:hypothetical protein
VNTTVPAFNAIDQLEVGLPPPGHAFRLLVQFFPSLYLISLKPKKLLRGGKAGKAFIYASATDLAGKPSL